MTSSFIEIISKRLRHALVPGIYRSSSSSPSSSPHRIVERVKNDLINLKRHFGARSFTACDVMVSDVFETNKLVTECAAYMYKKYCYEGRGGGEKRGMELDIPTTAGTTAQSEQIIPVSFSVSPLASVFCPLIISGEYWPVCILQHPHVSNGEEEEDGDKDDSNANNDDKNECGEISIKDKESLSHSVRDSGNKNMFKDKREELSGEDYKEMNKSEDVTVVDDNDQMEVDIQDMEVEAEEDGDDEDEDEGDEDNNGVELEPLKEDLNLSPSYINKHHSYPLLPHITTATALPSSVGSSSAMESSSDTPSHSSSIQTPYSSPFEGKENINRGRGE
jgi:hypothetical protein